MDDGPGSPGCLRFVRPPVNPKFRIQPSTEPGTSLPRSTAPGRTTVPQWGAIALALDAPYLNLQSKVGNGENCRSKIFVFLLSRLQATYASDENDRKRTSNPKIFNTSIRMPQVHIGACLILVASRLHVGWVG